MTTVSNKESTLEVCGMQPVRKQKNQAIFWADEFVALEFSFYCKFNLYAMSKNKNERIIIC